MRIEWELCRFFKEGRHSDKMRYTNTLRDGDAYRFVVQQSNKIVGESIDDSQGNLEI